MDNPYQSPMSEDRVVGVNSGSREDLRNVAKYQSAGILLCILFNIIAIASRFFLPPGLQILLYIASGVLSIAGTVFASCWR